MGNAESENSAKRSSTSALDGVRVSRRDDGDILIDIAGRRLIEGRYRIASGLSSRLTVPTRRPLAALLDTGHGEARFELGTAEVTDTGIELSLFGPLRLPVQYLIF